MINATPWFLAYVRQRLADGVVADYVLYPHVSFHCLLQERFCRLKFLI